jgi:uncharacterized protein YjbI with pentapeptide repeats
MFARRRTVQLKRYGHRSSHSGGSVSINHVLRILSSLILPCTLGTFTVFITVYQHMSAKTDRREDLRRADIQRNKDLLRFQDQRRKDRKELRLQREQELFIAKANRDSKSIIAINQYQDVIFKDYIKEIGDIMKENNGSLTSNRLTVALARVKTLIVLRQLDGSRQAHVVRFLYETAKLSDKDEPIAVVLKTAELTNVNFQQITWSGKIENMSFPDISLRNCTFGERTKISFVNFTSTHFHYVNFSSTRLIGVDFSFTNFRYGNFLSATIVNANFSSIMMSTSNFSMANIRNISFSFATLWTTKFSSSVIRNMNFSSASLGTINFSLAQINTVTFSFAKLGAVNFSSAKLNDADFSSVQFGMNDIICFFS